MNESDIRSIEVNRTRYARTNDTKGPVNVLDDGVEEAVQGVEGV